MPMFCSLELLSRVGRMKYCAMQLAVNFQLVLCPLVIEQAQRNLQKHFPQFVDRFEKLIGVIEYELESDPTVDEVMANKNLVR